MIKKWLSIFILIFIVQFSMAQRLRFGISLNPGLSWMKSDMSRIVGDGAHLGINGGLVAERYFAAHYAFSTGLSIHTMGGKLNYLDGKVLRTEDGNKTLTPGTVKYNLQYLHIPLGLKLKTTEIGYNTYFVDLGLDPMFNVKSTADVDGQSINKARVGKEINFLYMAYHVSAGLEYRLVGSTSVVMGINYMNGFSDVTDNYLTAIEKSVMHCFEFRVGILF